MALNFDGLPGLFVLWSKFIARLCSHWQSETILPGVASDGTIDMHACLVVQKLQLLNVCIQRRANSRLGFRDTAQSSSVAAFTLSTGEPVQFPVVQVEGPMTSDLLEARESLLADLGSSVGAARLRAKMQAGSLISDMSSFKACNPGCSLTDFVRWHSPNDFRDGQLSGRMTEPDNLWVELWRDAPATPAAAQVPLFDAATMGCQTLDYLQGVSDPSVWPPLTSSSLVSQLLFETAGLLGRILSGAPDCQPLLSVKLALEQFAGSITINSGEFSPDAAFDSLNTLEIVVARAQSLYQKLTSFSPAVVDAILCRPDEEILLHPDEDQGHKILLDFLLKTAVGPRVPDVCEHMIEKALLLTSGSHSSLLHNRIYALVSEDELKIALQIESPN